MVVIRTTITRILGARAPVETNSKGTVVVATTRVLVGMVVEVVEGMVNLEEAMEGMVDMVQEEVEGMVDMDKELEDVGDKEEVFVLFLTFHERYNKRKENNHLKRDQIPIEFNF